MRCECEARGELKPAEIAPGLTALHCAECGGSLLAMEDYHRWRERRPALPVDAPPAPPSVEEPAGVRSCPCCGRLMQRYRVGTVPDFRIDRCTHCQQAWFDPGEWRALAAVGLADRLGEVLSDSWQRKLQADALRMRREAGLREKFGDACVDELGRVRAWLETQPPARRDELLALLRSGW